ncbi:hypothetical protein G7046_g3923 [Stylonectria norvegica]|nr:hypothetical protein G7046_g3923 [Stylonectria norvegica]
MILEASLVGSYLGKTLSSSRDLGGLEGGSMQEDHCCIPQVRLQSSSQPPHHLFITITREAPHRLPRLDVGDWRGKPRYHPDGLGIAERELDGDGGKYTRCYQRLASPVFNAPHDPSSTPNGPQRARPDTSALAPTQEAQIDNVLSYRSIPVAWHSPLPPSTLGLSIPNRQKGRNYNKDVEPWHSPEPTVHSRPAGPTWTDAAAMRCWLMLVCSPPHWNFCKGRMFGDLPDEGISPGYSQLLLPAMHSHSLQVAEPSLAKDVTLLIHVDGIAIAGGLVDAVGGTLKPPQSAQTNMQPARGNDSRIPTPLVFPPQSVTHLVCNPNTRHSSVIMTTATQLDKDVIAQAGLADLEHHGLASVPAKGSIDITKTDIQHDIRSYTNESRDDVPTDEELRTLRRVSGKIKWAMFTIAFVELCERFSYYGSSVLYTNFVGKPLPDGSVTGAPLDPEGQAGALGMGTAASQGISLFNQFFAYIMPLVGAWIADARLGRFWTIHIAIGISTIAHVILVAASAPGVIVKPDAAFGAFIIGLLTLCVGTGFFKANVSPLLAEQNEDTVMRVEVQKGERVIIDPALTNTRIFLYFYLCINLGSMVGQIAMVYVEKYEGFWLAFLIPTIMFLTAPLVLWSQKKNYKLSPPTGSLLSKFLRMFRYVQKRGSFFKPNWELAKPSNVPVSERPSWMTYDDAWVDEVRRGLMACKVFLFLPIFFLAYNQMTGNLTLQASTMELHGTPNDIMQNLNPISIVLMIPLIDHGLYPLLRKLGIAFTPIKRMAVGFFVAALSMVASAVMQYYIYTKSPCGWYANGTDENGDVCEPAPINAWAQVLPYILIGLSEIFTNVTSYEYAYSKAPDNMKSLVMSVNLFMSAISAAIGQAFTPLSLDPLLVWNYTVVACIAFVGGLAFWFSFRHLDADEDKWNLLKKSEYKGKTQPNAVNQKLGPDQTDVDVEKL